MNPPPSGEGFMYLKSMSMSMKKGLWVLLVSLLSLTAGAQSLRYDAKLRVGQLDNGLTYYIYPNPTPKGEAVYRLFVKAGSVHERDDQQGLAHFLEHLAFNGTRHFPSDGIVRFLESRGAKFGKDLNAHTSFTETVYKLQLPTTDPLLVDTTLTILADWADGLLISADEVEKERGVILSERLQRSGAQTDHQMALVMELLNGSLYSRRITIGDTAVISHATPQTIRQYYEQWYRPELMAVAVVGDVDAARVEQLIREKFAGLTAKSATAGTPVLSVESVHQGSSGKDVAANLPPIPEYAADSARIVTTPGVEKIDFDILMLLPQPPAVQTAADYRLYLLRSLVNSLAKQRFNALSFLDPAYARGSVQYSRFLGATGVTDASVELTRGKVRKGISDFVSSYVQMLRYGFTQSEIARAKKQIVSRLENKVANGDIASTSLMSEIYADFYDGNRLISRADELALVKQFLPQIDSVGLVQFLQQTFETRPQHYLLRGGVDVLGEVGSFADLKQLIADARRQPVVRYWHNVDVPDALVTLKPTNRHIVSERSIPAIDATDLLLDNGARVIFRRSATEHDRLTLSAFRKGGQYGLDSTRYYTSLVGPSVVSLSGAGDFSREALNHYLTGNTASVRLLVDKLRCGVAASAHTADIETMFQLLYLRWTQPRLDTAVVRMTLNKLRESYLTRKDTPRDRFSRELGWLMSGRNYTSEPLSDSIVDHCVRQDDMLPLQHRFYGPATGYTFVILADCDLDDVRTYISTYLGALPSGKPDTTWQVSDRQIPQHDVELIRYTNDQPKAMVSLVYQQDRPMGNFLEQELKGTVLKSLLRTVLLKRLREEMGRVYSVSASVAASQYPSYLSRATIAFVCQPEDVDTLIAATREELQQLVANPTLFEAALADVKQNLIKEHSLQQQQTAYWTSWIRNSVYNNHEDWTWVSRYSDVVDRLTMADVAAYARHILHEAHRVKAVLLPASPSPTTHHPSPTTISGLVFNDRDGNGRQDDGEKGLKGILVSNGDTIVVTGKDGRYELPAVEGSGVMPILPSNYTMAGSRVVNANFTATNFALVKKPVNRRFRLNAIGDVQVGNYQELDYANRTLWPELLTPTPHHPSPTTHHPSPFTINLFLGDLVNNNLSLYGDLRALMEQLPQPTWTVLGNHDRDVDTVRWRQTATYRHVFGSDMYAFNEGRVHFIILNNVYGDGARGYRGYLSDRQLRFVRQDLQYVPQGTLIVLSMHIPLAHTRNRADLLRQLEGRGDVLAVTGHMHQVARFFHQGQGVRVHELSAGATCGFWWVGEKDAYGIPAAQQQCGTPRNYFVIDFNDTSYQLRCKAVGLDARRQMTIHVTGIDTLDTHLRDLRDVPAGQLLLTVYGGCDSTSVRCRLDGGEWMPCQHTPLVDPNVARTREMNLLKAYPTTYNRMNPLRHRESQQLWTLTLPEACRQGAHRVEVEATDPWGFSATGSRSFCFPRGVQ